MNFLLISFATWLIMFYTQPSQLKLHKNLSKLYIEGGQGNQPSMTLHDIAPQRWTALRKTIPFVFGIVIGCSFAMFWVANLISRLATRESQFVHLVERYGRNDKNPILEDFNLANKLYNEVRVVCLINTMQENHFKRVIHVKNTWGSRCNKLIFLSTQKDDELGTVALNVSEGRKFLWPKIRESFKYAYDNYFNDYDWFLKADDDTYVILENLRYFLHSYDPESPIYFGFKFKELVKQGYMSGGAGYVLSREALRRFIEICLPNEEAFRSEIFPSEDVTVGQCLEYVNVTAGDTRDPKGRGTFFPFDPVTHLVPNWNSTHWYWTYKFYDYGDGLDCCSDNAVSFHYIPPKEMYVLDYLIYSVQPYGIVNYPEALRAKPKTIVT